MDQTINIQKPTKKIYKDRAISVGTFLGGPLVAGYFIAENFKVFGEYEKAKKTWIYTIIATVIIFGGIFLIPDDVKVPNQIIPLVYTGIAIFLLKHFQGKNIENHINSGGGFFGWWRIIGVGFIGLAVILVTIFSVVILTDTSAANETSKSYGALKHMITFDKNNISANEVDQLAHHLTEITFFD